MFVFQFDILKLHVVCNCVLRTSENSNSDTDGWITRRGKMYIFVVKDLRFCTENAIYL